MYSSFPKRPEVDNIEGPYDDDDSVVCSFYNQGISGFFDVTINLKQGQLVSQNAFLFTDSGPTATSARFDLWLSGDIFQLLRQWSLHRS